MRETRIYQFNRQATFYAFVAFRILPIPFYWAAALYNVRQPGIQKLDLPLKMILLVSGVALDCLNINWCMKLSKGKTQIVRKWPLGVTGGHSKINGL